MLLLAPPSGYNIALLLPTSPFSSEMAESKPLHAAMSSFAASRSREVGIELAASVLHSGCCSCCSRRLIFWRRCWRLDACECCRGKLKTG